MVLNFFFHPRLIPERKKKIFRVWELQELNPLKGAKTTLMDVMWKESGSNTLPDSCLEFYSTLVILTQPF